MYKLKNLFVLSNTFVRRQILTKFRAKPQYHTIHDAMREGREENQVVLT